MADKFLLNNYQINYSLHTDQYWIQHQVCWGRCHLLTERGIIIELLLKDLEPWIFDKLSLTPRGVLAHRLDTLVRSGGPWIFVWVNISSFCEYKPQVSEL